MLQKLRRIFFRTLYFTGIGHLLKYFNRRNYRVPILLFHRISDNPDPYWSPLSNRAFEKILVFFGKKYKFRHLDQLFTQPVEELKDSCFIVFDDAYKDFLENALPLLSNNNIQVTMFVPAESVDTGIPVWTTWLNMCIDESGITHLDIISDNAAGYALSNKQTRIETAARLTKWLKSLPYKEFKSSFNEIIHQTGKSKSRNDIEVMNWEQIKRTKTIVDYQSHSMTHPMLGNIKDEEDLNFEIGDSKKILEQNIGINIKYISYPIGSYSKPVIEESKKHYHAAFAVDGELVKLKMINDPDYRYKIPRFNVSDSDPYELFFRVNGFHKLLGR